MLSWPSCSDARSGCSSCANLPIVAAGLRVCNLRPPSSRRLFLERGWRTSSAPITESSRPRWIEPSAVAITASSRSGINRRWTGAVSGNHVSCCYRRCYLVTSIHQDRVRRDFLGNRPSTERGDRSKASKEGKFWQDKFISIGIAIDFATADMHTAANACSARLPAFLTQSPCDVINLAGRNFEAPECQPYALQLSYHARAAVRR